MNITRRTFLGTSGVLSLAGAAGAAVPAPSDRITVGMIAVGSRAQELLEAIKTVSGTEIMAVCDAYTGRVERAIARTNGRAKAYESAQAIIEDKSIDVVVVATPDHLHKEFVIASLEAGKDVYCEKPLTYTVDEGLEIAASVKSIGRLMQVGSQGISSQTQRKAKEFIQSGKLGQITIIQANYNRNTASGAWIYPIPPDASPQTVNWDMFQGSAPKHPFSLERFFRWRCYQEYSGGIATDLFVHLCTTIHYLMDAKMPARVAAMGNLYRWKESARGRPWSNSRLPVNSIRFSPGRALSSLGALTSRDDTSRRLRNSGTRSNWRLTSSSPVGTHGGSFTGRERTQRP